MKTTFRCDCPISSALDIVGDKWTLVVVKQMLLEDRHTFKDLQNGDEQIATNILANRLKLLEHYQMIEKHKLPNNKKTNIYRLTEKGLTLVPLIIELVLWSESNLKDIHPTISIGEIGEKMKTNRNEVIAMFKNMYNQRLNQVLGVAEM